MIDCWMYEWLSEWMIEWMIDGMIDWIIEWLIGWMNDWGITRQLRNNTLPFKNSSKTERGPCDFLLMCRLLVQVLTVRRASRSTDSTHPPTACRPESSCPQTTPRNQDQGPTTPTGSSTIHKSDSIQTDLIRSRLSNLAHMEISRVWSCAVQLTIVHLIIKSHYLMIERQSMMLSEGLRWDSNPYISCFKAIALTNQLRVPLFPHIVN